MSTKSKQIVFGGVKLDVVNQSDPQVPMTAQAISLPKEDARALALAVKHNHACLLMGETGTGKTSAVRFLAHKLGQGYTRINMHGYNTPDELIGSKSINNGSTYYENGILTQAMIKGHIVVLDEINATPPDCMFILHGLLDDDRQISLPNGDVIRPHKDFRFFATMNPDYEGTRGLNRAFMDRFGIILSVDVLKPDAEQKVLSKRANIQDDMAEKMVTVAWMARKAYQEQKTLTFVSTRSLLQWADLIKAGLDEKTSYIKSIVNKARSEEQSAFADFYNAVFKSAADDRDTTPTIITKAELKELKENLDVLRSELQNLRDKLQIADRDIADRNEKISSLEKELEGFADASKLEDKVRELTEQKKNLQDQIRRIADAITV